MTKRYCLCIAYRGNHICLGFSYHFPHSVGKCNQEFYITLLILLQLELQNDIYLEKL